MPEKRRATRFWFSADAGGGREEGVKGLRQGAGAHRSRRCFGAKKDSKLDRTAKFVDCPRESKTETEKPGTLARNARDSEASRKSGVGTWYLKFTLKIDQGARVKKDRRAC